MSRSKTIILLFLAVLATGFISAQELPKVSLITSAGTIVVEVDTLRAPLTAGNFLRHVENGTYNNAFFYRVVKSGNQPNNPVKIEVIQGGLRDDEKIDGIQPIRHESTRETGILHKNGTISMARYTPGTASTEFFICVGDQPELDFGGRRNPDGQGFAAFGKVLEGMDVVRKIQQQEDDDQMLIETVQILGMKVFQ